jgi:hypothetical protein
MLRFLALAPLSTFLVGMLIGYYIRPDDLAKRKQENLTPQTPEEEAVDVIQKLFRKHVKFNRVGVWNDR